MPRSRAGVVPVPVVSHGCKVTLKIMIDPEFLEVLACPSCHGSLREKGETLVCVETACGLAYPVEDGIPILLVDEAVRGDGDASDQ